jgi:hypothetical protein
VGVQRFGFAFDALFRAAALPFGVTPSTAVVVLDNGAFRARFGPWRVSTPLANIVAAEVTGPYRRIKTAGPARLSFSDRGLTFATNSRRGVCLTFAQPVAGLEPTGRLRHPNLTVTVADPAGLVAALNALRPAAD